MSRVPTFEYPITRSFPGRWFAPAAFTGAVVALVLLATINAASAGYETVTGFDSDFNVTQVHWFSRIVPALVPKPGTLCDPRLLGLGDTIITNNTLFQYTVASIDKPNAGKSGLAYKGWTLDNCDITSLYVNGNADTFVIDFTALISCRADGLQIAQGNNYQITARTDWSESTLDGKYGSLLGAQRAAKNRQAGTVNATTDAQGTVLDAVSALSSVDFATRILSLDTITNGSFPTIISFQADFPWCPPAFGRDAPCALQVPPVNITSIFEYIPSKGSRQFDSTEPLSDSNQPLVTNDTSAIISNLVQSAYAAVRFDLGNPSPNNFLLNTSMIPEIINASFPQTFPGLANESLLYTVLVGGTNAVSQEAASHNIQGLLPLTLPGPAVIDGVYLCRFKRTKSPGSAFLSVLVGTLSMFSSAWAIFLGVAAGLVKRRQPWGHKQVCGSRKF
ncbi:hypothetical protein DFH06DRAFT_1092796 [Mycena polygramma]|nr:hypothetical protein DFH06DRAFT_1092796 [Mycena polygramma]